MKPTITKSQCQRWIAHLRSGHYEQGQRSMYNPDTNCYCCLGVLARDLHWLENMATLDTEFLCPGDEDEDGDQVLTLGTSINGGEWEPALAVLNDGGAARSNKLAASVSIHTQEKEEPEDNRIEPHTFTEIADIIQEHILPQCPD